MEADLTGHYVTIKSEFADVLVVVLKKVSGLKHLGAPGERSRDTVEVDLCSAGAILVTKEGLDSAVPSECPLSCHPDAVTVE